MHQSIESGIASLWELVFPSQCPICGDSSAAQRSACCLDCQKKIIETERAKCLCCSAPVGLHLEQIGNCYHCRDEKYRFTRAVSLGEYRDELRAAVLRGKDNFGGPTIAAMSLLLVDEIRMKVENLQFDCVVPVPQHWWNGLWRTQYAPETMARVISRELKLRCPISRLRKVRWTLQQTDVTASKRRSQLRDAFRAAKRFRWGRVLLVDDIMTTGATCDRSARALLDAGATEVVVAVLARSVGGR